MAKPRCAPARTAPSLRTITPPATWRRTRFAPAGTCTCSTPRACLSRVPTSSRTTPSMATRAAPPASGGGQGRAGLTRRRNDRFTHKHDHVKQDEFMPAIAFEYPDEIVAIADGIASFIKAEVIPRHQKNAALFEDPRKIYDDKGAY